MIIRPTDQEIGKDICIAAVGYDLESIARDEAATIAEPAGVDSLLRSRRGSRQIEYNTGWLGRLSWTPKMRQLAKVEPCP